MKHKLLILLIIFFLFNLKIKSQFFDSIPIPKKASIYSAVLPGLGQMYNKKYWKIPVVYATIGGLATASIMYNNIQLSYRNELKSRIYDNTSSKYLNYNNEDLYEYMKFYRKWRDNFIIIGSVFYILNIIDANIDAHLFRFDVNEDLSFSIVPQINKSNNNYSNIYTLGLTFNF